MNQEIKEIQINGITYVPKDAKQGNVFAADTNGKPFVIVRGQASGVQFGYLHEHAGQQVVLHNARRVWYWNGACSLSQMAVDGVKAPEDCKFSVVVPVVTILDAVEIIPCSSTAQTILEGIPEWKS